MNEMYEISHTDNNTKLPAVQSSTRRHLMKLGALALAAAGLMGGWIVLRFLGYRRLSRRPTRFVAGGVGEFPLGTLVLRKGVWIGHDEGGLYGLLNLCTHLGCHPGWVASQRILECPCHGSRFDIHGQVLKGPARAPLKRVHLAWRDGKEVVVDLEMPVTEFFRLKASQSE